MKCLLIILIAVNLSLNGYCQTYEGTSKPQKFNINPEQQPANNSQPATTEYRGGDPLKGLGEQNSNSVSIMHLLLALTIIQEHGQN
jgi:hypothetical protein